MIIQKFNIYNAGWLDIVFDNRNKSYGAYELRSHYANIMLRSIGITIFSVASLVLTLSIITRKLKLAVITQEHTTIVDLTKVMQPPPAKPIKPAKVMPPAAQAHFKTIAIPTHVTPDEVKTDPPTLTEIEHASIGPETHKGDAAAANAPIATSAPGTGSAGNESAGNGNEILPFADVSSEPNGGIAAWFKFLQSHIRYPDTEVQGRVILSFVVERDGSLTDIKVVKSIDSQLDAEALRVLKIAPKWKPGMQAGKPVRVQYTIPINFQLNN